VGVDLPPGLAHWAGRPGGPAWLEALPRLAEECAAAWDLELEAPFTGGVAALVVPAGERVLKLNPEDPESEHEGAALAHWGGRGAVRLLAADPARRALLLDRCRPGSRLWDVEDEDEVNLAAAGVLRELWRPAPPQGPFAALADEAARWARELPGRWRAFGRPCPERVLEQGLAWLAAPPAPDREVLLHQDLHGGNVLRDGDGWLAVDPKPLVGDRAFDLASLLRDRRPSLARDPAPRKRIRRRLDVLAEATGLERERLRGWGVAHSLTWGIESSGVHADVLACAGWLAGA
jgi:streptomycin 6-kinase